MLPRSEREPIDNTADEASRALLAPPFAAPREPREPRALLATPLVFVVVWVRASAEEGAFAWDRTPLEARPAAVWCART